MALQSALMKLRGVDCEATKIPTRSAVSTDVPRKRSLFLLDDSDFDEDDIFKDPVLPHSSSSSSQNESDKTDSVPSYGSAATAFYDTTTSCVGVGVKNTSRDAEVCKDSSVCNRSLAVEQSACVPASKLTHVQKLNSFRFVKNSGSRKRALSNEPVTTPLPVRKKTSQLEAAQSSIATWMGDNDMDTESVCQEDRTTGAPPASSTSSNLVIPSWNVTPGFATSVVADKDIRSGSECASRVATPTSTKFATPTRPPFQNPSLTPTSKFATPTKPPFRNPSLTPTSKFATPTKPPFRNPSLTPQFSSTTSIVQPPPSQSSSSSNPGSQFCPPVSCSTPQHCPPPSDSTTHTPSRRIVDIVRNIGRRPCSDPQQTTPKQSALMTASSTPLSRPPTHSTATPLSSQPTPLICTPTIGPGGIQEVEIVRTPVALAKRKFPGPAGLLPPMTPGMNLDNIHIAPPSTPVPACTPKRRLRALSCARENESTSKDTSPEVVEFDRGPWIEMLQDLDLNDSYSSSLLHYSTSNAIKQYSKKELSRGKIAHLRVILKSIVPAGRNASAVLKDPTGEIMCTIHSQVLEENQQTLQPGAVLVLRQVSMFSPSPRKHYLNITPPNVVRVYPPIQSANNRQSLTQTLSDMEKKFSESTDSTPMPPPPSLTPHPSPSTTPLFRTPILADVRRGQDRAGTAAERGLHTLCQQQRGQLLGHKSLTPTFSQQNNARLAFGGALSVGRPVPCGADRPSGDMPGPPPGNNQTPGSSRVGAGAASTTACTLVTVGNKTGDTSPSCSRATNVDSAFFSNLCEDEFNAIFADIGCENFT